MRSRYKPFYLTSEYALKVVSKGKCQLDGPHKYVPMFTACEFPSKGFRTTARSWINQDLVELMSEIEYDVFVYLEYDPVVVRIASQCALDPAETLQIALEIGKEHPAIAEGPIIMSTDFVVDELRQGVGTRRAISVKREVDLSERVLEKAEIERRYWARRGVNWSLFLDSQLPASVVSNARLLQPRMDEDQLPCDGTTVALIASWLTPHLEIGLLPLGTLCRRCDQAGLYPVGTSLAVALHLTGHRHWPIDMGRPIAGHLPLPLLAKFLGQN